jgi:phage regulator Rha-like protein
VEEKDLIPQEIIESKIFLIRGRKVVLDRDLAALYGVETKAINQAVKRNSQRFPDDFMFRLSAGETQQLLRSQFVTLKRGQHYKYLPYVFTENGVAMLSSVLNSERAIQVNITMMRVFVRLRQMMASHSALAGKLAELEERIQDHDEQITDIFKAIRQLITPPIKPKRKIGFDLKEKQARYSIKKSSRK